MSGRRSPRPLRRRCAERASSRAACRSAAGRTAPSSARGACRRRTCSPAATSTTPCASGPRSRTWRPRRRWQCGSRACGPSAPAEPVARTRSLLIAEVGELTVLRDRERPTGRLLRQGDMDASYVDLADARHLEFDYLRRMRDLVEATRARRIVHVGGAACALPRALAAADDGLRQDVVEIDPGVLAVARAHLGLRRAPGLRVR